MSNPFEDDGDDPFALSTSKKAPTPQYAGGQSKPDAASVMAKQLAVRNGAGGASANEKAARMFAASQAAAQEAESHANDSHQLEGAAASQFASRERNARYSMVQQGGPGMAFPMTDLVDAQNEKSMGLSFASLAVRDGPVMGAHSEEGMVSSQQQQARPAGKLNVKSQQQAQAADPWSNSAFAEQVAANPFSPKKSDQQPASVFRNPPAAQAPRQQPQQQQRAPAPQTMDFDPLSFGMDAPVQQQQPQQRKQQAAASDPWAQAADPFGGFASGGAAQPAPAAVQKKPKKAAPLPVAEPESSSDEETDSDDESEEQRRKREKAERQAAKQREELKAQREKERAEAVAYDEARKRSLKEQQQQRSAASSSSAAGSRSQGGQPQMQSRAIDPDDADAREVARNETDHAKLQRTGTKQTYSRAVIEKWGNNPAEHWAYSKSKTRSKLLMPKVCVYWRFIWAGERHEVELFHSTVSGKRTVRCDGALVAQEKIFIDTGSRHDFTVGSAQKPCQLTVLIVSSGSDYAYELFINRQRFYMALQSWLASIMLDPSQGRGLEPLSPTAINTVGASQPSSKYR